MTSIGIISGRPTENSFDFSLGHSFLNKVYGFLVDSVLGGSQHQCHETSRRHRRQIPNPEISYEVASFV